MQTPTGKKLIEVSIDRIKKEAIRLLEECAGSNRNDESDASKVLFLLDKKESDYTSEELIKIKTYLEKELISRVRRRIGQGGALVGYFISDNTLENAKTLPNVHQALEQLRKVRDNYDGLSPSGQATIDTKVLALWQEMTDVKNAAGFTDKAWHTIITLVKHVVEAFMKLFNSEFENDKTYSGAIRKPFWKDNKAKIQDINSPDPDPSCKL